MQTLEFIKKIIDGAHPGAVLSCEMTKTCPRFDIQPEKIVEVSKTFRDHPDLQYVYCVDVFGMDHGEDEDQRFSSNYSLHSIENKSLVLLRCRLEDEDEPTVETVSGVWKNAEWLEREAYDMFGIIYKNHPDLRRILMPQDYKAWPLRKENDWRANIDEAFPNYRPGQWHSRIEKRENKV